MRTFYLRHIHDKATLTLCKGHKKRLHVLLELRKPQCTNKCITLLSASITIDNVSLSSSNVHFNMYCLFSSHLRDLTTICNEKINFNFFINNTLELLCKLSLNKCGIGII